MFSLWCYAHTVMLLLCHYVNIEHNIFLSILLYLNCYVTSVNLRPYRLSSSTFTIVTLNESLYTNIVTCTLG